MKKQINKLILNIIIKYMLKNNCFSYTNDYCIRMFSAEYYWKLHGYLIAHNESIKECGLEDFGLKGGKDEKTNNSTSI